MHLFSDINEIVLDERHAPFNVTYLQRVMKVLCNALGDHPKTTVIRVDLRLPEYRDVGDSLIYTPDLRQGLLSRFIESLKAKIAAYLKRKAREDKRVHRNTLRYIWVMEQPELFGKKHFHTALFVNTRCFNSLGSYKENGTGLASLIQEAWLSALGMHNCMECRGLARFPKHPMYYLNASGADLQGAVDDLTFRLSYMSKERTKMYSSSERSFGCSQD